MTKEKIVLNPTIKFIPDISKIESMINKEKENEEIDNKINNDNPAQIS
jgi:hypothetical protein